jgi:hypothetical protein
MALWDNIQGRWKLSGGDWTDISGNGNDLAASASAPTQTTGHGGGANLAASFVHTSSQYLHITDATQTGLDITGSITISGWVKPTRNGVVEILWSKSGASGQYSYGVYRNTGNQIVFQLSANGTSTASATSSGTILQNNMYHVACVYDGVDMRIYINGTLASTPVSYTAGIFNSNSDLVIGANGTKDNYFWSGAQDDFAIWSRALSSTEVTQLYNLGDDFPFENPVLEDTGTGVDSVSVVRLVSVSDTGSGADSPSLSYKEVTVTDTGTGVDVATGGAGDPHPITDSGSGTDAVSIRATVPVTDTGTGTDSVYVLKPTELTLKKEVHGFPPGQTVEYRLTSCPAGGAEVLIQDWTSDDVEEKTLTSLSSDYLVWIAPLAHGRINWRIGSSYDASESWSSYESNNDVAASTRLASADYTAPDNAGIAANGAAIASLQSDITSLLSYAISMSKWKNNKLARISVVGTVETWVLYDDDNTTPLLTWTHDTSTKARGKAT